MEEIFPTHMSATNESDEDDNQPLVNNVPDMKIPMK